MKGAAPFVLHCSRVNLPPDGTAPTEEDASCTEVDEVYAQMAEAMVKDKLNWFWVEATTDDLAMREVSVGVAIPAGPADEAARRPKRKRRHSDFMPRWYDVLLSWDLATGNGMTSNLTSSGNRSCCDSAKTTLFQTAASSESTTPSISGGDIARDGMGAVSCLLRPHGCAWNAGWAKDVAVNKVQEETEAGVRCAAGSLTTVSSGLILQHKYKLEYEGPQWRTVYAGSAQAVITRVLLDRDNCFRLKRLVMGHWSPWSSSLYIRKRVMPVCRPVRIVLRGAPAATVPQEAAPSPPQESTAEAELLEQPRMIEQDLVKWIKAVECKRGEATRWVVEEQLIVEYMHITASSMYGQISDEIKQQAEQTWGQLLDSLNRETGLTDLQEWKNRLRGMRDWFLHGTAASTNNSASSSSCSSSPPPLPVSSLESIPTGLHAKFITIVRSPPGPSLDDRYKYAIFDVLLTLPHECPCELSAALKRRILILVKAVRKSDVLSQHQKQKVEELWAELLSRPVEPSAADTEDREGEQEDDETADEQTEEETEQQGREHQVQNTPCPSAQSEPVDDEAGWQACAAQTDLSVNDLRESALSLSELYHNLTPIQRIEAQRAAQVIRASSQPYIPVAPSSNSRSVTPVVASSTSAATQGSEDGWMHVNHGRARPSLLLPHDDDDGRAPPPPPPHAQLTTTLSASGRISSLVVAQREGFPNRTPSGGSAGNARGRVTGDGVAAMASNVAYRPTGQDGDQTVRGATRADVFGGLVRDCSSTTDATFPSSPCFSSSSPLVQWLLRRDPANCIFPYICVHFPVSWGAPFWYHALENRSYQNPPSDLQVLLAVVAMARQGEPVDTLRLRKLVEAEHGVWSTKRCDGWDEQGQSFGGMKNCRDEQFDEECCRATVETNTVLMVGESGRMNEAGIMTHSANHGDATMLYGDDLKYTATSDDVSMSDDNINMNSVNGTPSSASSCVYINNTISSQHFCHSPGVYIDSHFLDSIPSPTFAAPSRLATVSKDSTTHHHFSPFSPGVPCSPSSGASSVVASPYQCNPPSPPLPSAVPPPRQPALLPPH
eukprot:GHVS01008796.1.p1 GENE.GHVS01008796.1~~GHVS01008796.1.p1  ORF type:complete len:1062 (+),score=170.56 GHVS01008796.1:318-3503(+)